MSCANYCRGGFGARRRARAAAWAVAVLAAAPHATAAFVGDYSPASFALANVNADGFALMRPDGTLVLTGGNNGSGLPGTTDFTITVAGSGAISFTYSYASLDTPGFDFAGYLLDDFAQFAESDGQSGSVVLQARLGQIFGFRVGTADNTGEPGVLAISDFNAPSNAVPEPARLSLVSIGAACVAALSARRRVRAGERRP